MTVIIKSISNAGNRQEEKWPQHIGFPEHRNQRLSYFLFEVEESKGTSVLRLPWSKDKWVVVIFKSIKNFPLLLWQLCDQPLPLVSPVNGSPIFWEKQVKDVSRSLCCWGCPHSGKSMGNNWTTKNLCLRDRSRKNLHRLKKRSWGVMGVGQLQKLPRGKMK